MKKSLFYITPLLMFLCSCEENPQSGEMEPKWLFWVFLGLLLLGMLFGVVYSTVRKRNNKADENDITQKEIEQYEETLRKKLEEKDNEKEN